jgi:hypothetical protein
MVAFEHQIGANHDASPTFTGLTVDSHHVLGVLVQIVVAVHTKFEDHLERRRVVVIESKVFANHILVKVFMIVLSFRAQVINPVVLVMFLTEESLNIMDVVSVKSFFAF